MDKTALTFTTSNVSQGGLLFRSRRRLAVGAIVQLELRLPREAKTWSCTARVARVEEADGAYGIGVKIVHVEGADIFKFQRFVGGLDKQRRATTSSRKKRAG